ADAADPADATDAPADAGGAADAGTGNAAEAGDAEVAGGAGVAGVPDCPGGAELGEVADPPRRDPRPRRHVGQHLPAEPVAPGLLGADDPGERQDRTGAQSEDEVREGSMKRTEHEIPSTQVVSGLASPASRSLAEPPERGNPGLVAYNPGYPLRGRMQPVTGTCAAAADSFYPDAG